MAAPRKFDEETRARAVRMYQDRIREHGDSMAGARRHVGARADNHHQILTGKAASSPSTWPLATDGTLPEGSYDLFLKQHHPVILDAPFLSTLRAAADAGQSLGFFLRDHAGAEASVPVVTIWIDSPAEQIKQRMITRNSARDASKLTDWHSYQSSILDSGSVNSPAARVIS